MYKYICIIYIDCIVMLIGYIILESLNYGDLIIDFEICKL